MTRIFIVCGLVFLLFACKKDKLTNELSVFVGKWKLEWYVKKYYFPSIPYTGYDTITSLSDSYEMEFEKKGKVRFIKNGEEIEKYRVLIPIFRDETYTYEIINGKFFGLNLDNNEENFMNGFINSTNLLAFHNGFPFAYHEEGNADISYRCYFKKQ